MTRTTSAWVEVGEAAGWAVTVDRDIFSLSYAQKYTTVDGMEREQLR